MKVINLILCLYLLISCQPASNHLKIHVTSSAPEQIQVFYSDSYFSNYTEKNSITKSARAGKSVLTFNLETIPSIKSIRIDLGDSPQKRTLYIDTIEFNNRIIHGELLKDFFETNKEVFYDEELQAFSLKEQAEDPFIISKNLHTLSYEN